jgi:hypothetical protein
MTTQEACKRFGIEYQTAKNAKWVCETIERSLRRDLLTFHHHKEVAGRDDKAELLAWAAMTIERKAGEMLAAMEKNPGNRNLGGDTMSPPPSLESLGITKMQSSRWQKVTP